MELLLGPILNRTIAFLLHGAIKMMEGAVRMLLSSVLGVKSDRIFLLIKIYLNYLDIFGRID